jgi:hypothetical protein
MDPGTYMVTDGFDELGYDHDMQGPSQQEMAI